MDSVRFEVQGLRQLGEALRELAGPAAVRICVGATGTAARFVKEQAKNNIRASPAIDTGSLLESIIVKKIPKSQTNLTSAHIVTPRRRRTGSAKTRAKQSEAPHALFVEFGTEHMPAEPFLEPALSRNVSRTTQIMKDKLASGIEREAKKVSKT
jgi:HK97 gp10 family phage protein